MVRFVEGQGRHQVTLLPECLDDFVSEDNPVRVIDAYVEELDLDVLGFQGATPAATGRPAYHPAVLLKIYIHGYLNRVQSEPAPRARSTAQHRADVADGAPGSGLQDHRRFPP